MNEGFAMGLGRAAMLTALKVSAPILGVCLVVGLLISVLQAVTQVSEATLSFVPKALAIMLVILLLGPWMLNTLTAYAATIFSSLPALARQ